MLVQLSSPTDFYNIFPHHAIIFDSQRFVELNSKKVEAVRHFIGYDSNLRPRLGISLGYSNGEWHAPFSAPFSIPVSNVTPSIERTYDFFTELTDTLQAPIQITLPPHFYSEVDINIYGIVLANLAQKQFLDYNFHFLLDNQENFESLLDRSARKNYHRAIKACFDFIEDSPIERAYSVIAANRSSRGYPLAMTLEQLKNTIKPEGPVTARCFVLSKENIDVAAAIVYDVAPSIAQVIYWGDVPGFNEDRPMNILPKFLYDYYLKAGYKILDVGPSSKQGIPSSGLCRFKNSIGCKLTAKPTFRI